MNRRSGGRIRPSMGRRSSQRVRSRVCFFPAFGTCAPYRPEEGKVLLWGGGYLAAEAAGSSCFLANGFGCHSRQPLIARTVNESKEDDAGPCLPERRCRCRCRGRR